MSLWAAATSQLLNRSSQPGQGYRRAKASTVHGWVTKLRGTLFGNERTRQRGIREMQVASAVRQYKRERNARKQKRHRRGGFFSFLGSSRHRSRSKRRDRNHGTTVRERDYAHRHKGPWLHFPYRVRPHHHGHGTRLRGMLTGNREMVLIGRAMNDSARREREKKRRRRQRRLRREAEAMRDPGGMTRWDWRG